jgi:hypothetical protein
MDILGEMNMWIWNIGLFSLILIAVGRSSTSRGSLAALGGFCCLPFLYRLVYRAYLR